MNTSGPPRIRVLYDHQVFTWQRYGGISRYFADLFAQRDAMSGVEPVLSLRYSDNAHLADIPALRADLQPKSACRIPLKARLRRRYRAPYEAAAVNQRHTLAQLSAGAFDVFHPTYYDAYFLEALGGKPLVVTVYDLVHELCPEYYLTDTRIREKERVIRRADRLIAISHATKKDLVETYAIAPDKIDVVHLAAAFGPDTCASARLTVPGKFFLYVGERGKYKNCYFLIRALREIFLANPGLHLVCAGGGEFTEDERAFIDMLGLRGRVHWHEASNASLVALYRDAIALLAPSLYEGFGLPVAEAFNCGCAVVASRTPALEEVGGDAALFFDAKDQSSIRETIARVLREPGLVEELRQKSAKRAPVFSREKCARETAAVYRRVIDERLKRGG